jgi:chromosome segregation ATPase
VEDLKRKVISLKPYKAKYRELTSELELQKLRMEETNLEYRRLERKFTRLKRENQRLQSEYPSLITIRW